MINKILKQNPLVWAGLLSFALSLFLSFQDIVNYDGILYLNVARAFAEQNYAQAFSLYEWAFYPALIAGLSQLTTLSLENSAILINSSFMALMASGFVALTREMGANKNIQWIAVLVFLIHPGINGYREYIIRDFGAWAMLIWSLIYLCRFSKKPSWILVFGWTLSISLSILFRPEAIIWLILGPLALLVSMNELALKKRYLALLKINSLFIVGGLIGFLMISILHLSIPYTKLHQMQTAYTQMFILGIDRYAEKAQAFSDLMSIYFKFDHAVIVLGAALIFYVTFLTFKLLSLLYLALIGYGLFHRPIIHKPQVRILIWMLIVYAGVFLLFLGKNYFISSRYLIPWVTVVMVWVPFILARLWPTAPGALKATIGLIMLYMILDSVLSFGYSKMYIKEAGLWINHNTPTTARLFTDSNQVAYYADRTRVTQIENADVVALRSKYPQADFYNKRGDGIFITIISPIPPATSPQADIPKQSEPK